MVQVPEKLITLEEFLELPETKPASEYIDGRIIQKPMPQGKHSKLQGKLVTAINQIVEDRKIALAFPELRCTFGGRSIVPDVSVFAWERIPIDDNGDIANIFPVHPDWTIEILSPDQSPIKVIGNILHCLKQGSQMEWLIDPGQRSPIENLCLVSSVMDKTRQIKISKYLSKHLRHAPERLGLTLAIGGWVNVDELLSACAAHQFPITRAELEEVVANSDKQRFSFDETSTRIRANQGHSVDVDLELQPQIPPDVLYHGTGERSVSAILQSGLLKMSRHHVHLSQDVETARKVGMRHGRPVILAIAAANMHQAGFTFYCSDNGVWLVDEVPPQYLEVMSIQN